MQGPCCSFHLSSALLISLMLFFPAIPFKEHCFISSFLRHFYYLNHASCGNAPGLESLQGVISCLYSCWGRIHHLLKHWEYKLLLFLVLPAQLCLSYLFTLFRLPRLAERRLDIYSSLTLLMYYKISSKDTFQSLWVCTHLIYLFILESLSSLKRIKSLHK